MAKKQRGSEREPIGPRRHASFGGRERHFRIRWASVERIAGGRQPQVNKAARRLRPRRAGELDRDGEGVEETFTSAKPTRSRLAAETDLIIGLTACSAEMSYNYRSQAIEYEAASRMRMSKLTAVVFMTARIAWLYGALCLCVLPACTRPRTDIVATLSEDVGGYDLVRTTENAAFVGHVCVANPKHSDEIAARVIQQLSTQQFTTITVDVYSAAEPIARFVRDGARERRESLQVGSNPCANYR